MVQLKSDISAIELEALLKDWPFFNMGKEFYITYFEKKGLYIWNIRGHLGDFDCRINIETDLNYNIAIIESLLLKK